MFPDLYYEHVKKGPIFPSLMVCKHTLSKLFKRSGLIFPRPYQLYELLTLT